MEEAPARPAPPPLVVPPPPPVEAAPPPEEPAVPQVLETDPSKLVDRNLNEADLDRIVKNQVQREMVKEEARLDRTALKLDDLQRARYDAATWKWNAMKAKAALAETVAEQAAGLAQMAYEELLALARSFGIDTARNFRIDGKNRVTYPIGPSSRNEMPDYAPPEGKTVKR